MNIKRTTLPIKVFLFSILSSLVIQVLFLGTHWSAFRIWEIEFNSEIVYVYIFAMFFLALGNFVYAHLFRLDAERNKIPPIDQSKLIKLIKLTSILLVIFLIITQLSLGHAWLYNLWTGVVRAPDLEDAIRKSIFGVHSFLLIITFTSLILWMAYFRLGLKINRWLFFMLLMALLSSISQGKIQFLFYFFITYLLQQNESKVIRKTIISGILILIIFFITRLLRNQGVGLSPNLDTFLLFVVGLYLGSPFVNTTYILENQAGTIDLIIEFFKHMLPSRFYAETNIHSNFIDITSPAGFLGNGLLLGSSFGVYLYCFLVGIFISHLAVKSLDSLTFYLFYPILITSCVLVFLYDHFTNLAFFYIPMIICYLVSKYIALKN